MYKKLQKLMRESKKGGIRMNNVVSFDIIPNDLISFKEAYSLYGIKYNTLYKYTRILNEIPLYTKGGFKVSKKDVANWLKMGKIEAKKK